jgi:2-haloacid dehalogenase
LILAALWFTLVTMKKNYKYVLIDADGTFLDFEKAELSALNKTIDSLGFSDREYFIQAFLEINTGVWKSLEEGKIKPDQINERRFSLLHGDLSVEAPLTRTAKELGDYYLKHLCRGGFLLEGGREILNYLADKYTLILATNGLAQVQRARLKEAELISLFDKLAISQELGYHKPMVEFFEKALEGYDYSKDEVIMVGDSLFSDMAGADAFGIDSIWVNPNEILNDNIASPTYEIDCLLKIRSLL